MGSYVPLFRGPTVSMNAEEPQPSQKNGIASQERPITESRFAETSLPISVQTLPTIRSIMERNTLVSQATIVFWPVSKDCRPMRREQNHPSMQNCSGY
jgi:hypothetical protein